MTLQRAEARTVEEELSTQPECWRKASALARSGGYLPRKSARVALAGCGTSFFMAQAAAVWRETAGWGETDAFPASEMPVGRRYSTVVAISRSGTTTEVLRLIAALPEGTEVVAVTASLKSPLAHSATHVVELPFADEEAVVQTRFATSVLAWWRAHLGCDVELLAQQAEKALQADLPEGLEGYRQFVFLGRGAAAALAGEAALKFREAALAWSEAYPAMEFRHGPISLLERGSLVWSLGELPPGLSEEIRASGASLELSDADPLVELVRAQRAAVILAKARGLDPSRPRRLSRSVVLS
jgi:fructoselysine-6-P-deglycase FrlB-like protein